MNSKKVFFLLIILFSLACFLAFLFLPQTESQGLTENIINKPGNFQVKKKTKEKYLKRKTLNRKNLKIERKENEIKINKPKKNYVQLEGKCVSINSSPYTDCEIFLYSNKKLIEKTTPSISGYFCFSIPVSKEIAHIEVKGIRCVPLRSKDFILDSPRKIDLGLIKIVSGTHVVGRIVDKNGLPVGEAIIELNRDKMGLENKIFFSNPFAKTKQDGSFDLGFCLPGFYNVDVKDNQVITPKVVKINSDLEIQEIYIKVKSKSNMPFISGRILCDDMKALRKAVICVFDKGNSNLFKANPDRYGNFIIKRTKDGRRKGIEIYATAPGYDIEYIKGRYKWGDTGIILTLKKCGAIKLKVISEETGKPVENYGIRLYKLGANVLSKMDFNDLVLKYKGFHKNGELIVKNLYSFGYLIRVETDESSVFSSNFIYVKVENSRTIEKIIKLPKRVRRRLKLLSYSNKPISSCTVHLVQRYKHQITRDTEIVHPRVWNKTLVSNKALLIFTGKTDGNGEVILEGPSKKELGIKINGPKCNVGLKCIGWLDGKKPLVFLKMAVHKGHPEMPQRANQHPH